MTERAFVEKVMTLNRIIEASDVITWFDTWDRQEPKKKPLSFKFLNALAINKLELLPKAVSFRDASKKNKTLSAYFDAQIALDKKLCMKDDKGEAVVVNGRFIYPSPLEYAREHQKLREQYHEISEQLESELSKEIPVKLYMVQERYLPTEGITPSILASILDFVEPNPVEYVEPEYRSESVEKVTSGDPTSN